MGTGVVGSVPYYCSQIVQRASLLSLVPLSNFRIALNYARDSETIALIYFVLHLMHFVIHDPERRNSS